MTPWASSSKDEMGETWPVTCCSSVRAVSTVSSGRTIEAIVAPADAGVMADGGRRKQTVAPEPMSPDAA